MNKFYDLIPGGYPESTPDPTEVARGEGWILLGRPGDYTLSYLTGELNGGSARVSVTDITARQFQRGELSLDTWRAMSPAWLLSMEKRSWRIRVWEAARSVQDLLTNGRQKRRNSFAEQEHLRALRQTAETLWQAGQHKEAAALYTQLEAPTATEKKRMKIAAKS